MTIVRYNPWQEMATLQSQLESIFNNTTSVNRSYFPAAELTETKETFELKLELPGMNKSDIDVQAMANRIVVSGERQAPEAENLRSEFAYGKFQRAIALPKTIQNTEVTAQYNNGILHLTLPKTEAEKNRVVKVNLTEAAE